MALLYSSHKGPVHYLTTRAYKLQQKFGVVHTAYSLTWETSALRRQRARVGHCHRHRHRHCDAARLRPQPRLAQPTQARAVAFGSRAMQSTPPPSMVPVPIHGRSHARPCFVSATPRKPFASTRCNTTLYHTTPPHPTHPHATPHHANKHYTTPHHATHRSTCSPPTTPRHTTNHTTLTALPARHQPHHTTPHHKPQTLPLTALPARHQPCRRCERVVFGAEEPRNGCAAPQRDGTVPGAGVA